MDVAAALTQYLAAARGVRADTPSDAVLSARLLSDPEPYGM